MGSLSVRRYNSGKLGTRLEAARSQWKILCVGSGGERDEKYQPKS